MSASKTERLLAVSLVLINANRPLTRSEIRAAVRDYPRAAAQDAFERMFERDKEDLRSMGIPIESVPMENTEGVGYLIERSQAFLEPIVVDQAERVVLAVASRMWGEASWAHDAVNALRKIELSGEFFSDEAAEMALSVRVDSGKVASLLDATAARRAVKFDYLKSGTPDAQTRHVQPWGVVASRGQWYLVGHDIDRDDTRAFRLSRVTGNVRLQRGHDTFEIPAGVDLQKLVQSSFPPARTATVTLRLAVGRCAALRELAGAAADAELVVIADADPDRVLFEALAAGSAAEIVDPVELRSRAQAALAELIAHAGAELDDAFRSGLDDAASEGVRVPSEATSVQLSRLLALVPWLLANPGVTMADAAKHFQVSAARLREDLLLAVCTEFGANLITLDIDFWNDRITVRNAQGIDVPLRLTTSEATSLLLGLRMLAELPGKGDRAALDSVTAKIEAAAGEASRLVDHVAIASPVADAPARMSAITLALQDALRDKRAVQIEYRSGGRDEVTDRVVDPVGMLTTDGHTYLQAWCRRADAVRIFRIDRIAAARILDEPAVIPEGASVLPATVTIEGPDMTVRLDPDIAWWAEQVPNRARITLPDGSVAVTLQVASWEWAVRTALGFGGRLRVVSPEALTESVTSAASAAMRNYLDAETAT